jgi:dimeric dUTPase (all-alpha-NTP-PPase superfamily)
MSTAIHYWIEYKSNNGKWKLFNPKNTDKKGEERHFNSSYFQGWLRDQIGICRPYNDCPFANRNYPEDLSEELKVIIDNIPENVKKYRFNESYVTLFELSTYIEEKLNFIETQIKSLQKDFKLEIINKNILTLGKLISKIPTDQTLKELPNDDDFSENYPVISEYKEELEDVRYWYTFIDSIQFLIRFMTDELYVPYENIRLVYYYS